MPKISTKIRMTIPEKDRLAVEDFLADYSIEQQQKSLWPLIKVLYNAYEKHDKNEIFPLPRIDLQKFAVINQLSKDTPFQLLQDLTRDHILRAKVLVATSTRVPSNIRLERKQNPDGKIESRFVSRPVPPKLTPWEQELYEWREENTYELITDDNREVYNSNNAVIEVLPGFLYLYEILRRKAPTAQSTGDISDIATSKGYKLPQPQCVVKREKWRINKGEKVYLEEGFVRFGKKDEVLIGSANTRPFLYIQCLLRGGVGVPVTIDTAFEAVRHPKDNQNPRLQFSSHDNPEARTEKLRIIRHSCVKELQKKLEGRLEFKDDNRKTCWVEFGTTYNR